ncbi:Uncharacterized protein QTN25_007272 [Entamoeba marina]
MIDIVLLNKLLFDFDTGLLRSICRNLIYDADDTLCLKNGSVLMNYFIANNRLTELFLWSFKEEHIEKFHVAQCDTQNNTFFSIFNYLYAVDNLVDYLASLIQPLVYDPKYLSGIDTSLFRSNTEDFTEEMFSNATHSFNLIKEILALMQKRTVDNFNMLPNTYKNIVKELLNRVELDNEHCKYKTTQTLLSSIRKSVIVKFMKNKRLLKRIFPAKRIDEIYPQLCFIAETINKMVVGQKDNYIVQLMNEMQQLDSYEDIYNLFTKPSLQPEFHFELDESNISEIVFLLHSSIVPIRRTLSKGISFQLMKSLELSYCTYDDFMVYDKVIRSIEKFTRNYYTYFKSSLEEAQHKSKQLDKIKDEVERAQQELYLKQIQNDELRLRIEELEKEEDECEMDITEFLRKTTKEQVERSRSTSHSRVDEYVINRKSPKSARENKKFRGFGDEGGKKA